ncbi:hypothetical protein RFI_23166 [Reticulomyxa filosa]|uniref:Conserved oligomeric Golgi complex subunit 4 N-terminal domain-containing protein n=1 Tax=Reticulomyxa filosa TaxID=46433 RepID=X6ML62_RETFI|nr:hypothetical protein RFI_23166 [Reticulomyxa filosa]|eukprot:ETO14197.1 hypothetical protein RFI_23166 [Reticulomyxa filosa]
MEVANDSDVLLSIQDVSASVKTKILHVKTLDNLLFEKKKKTKQNKQNERADIGLVQNKAQTMHKRLQKAFISAQDISSQAQQLDKSQTRVEQVLQRVKLILDLKVEKDCSFNKKKKKLYKRNNFLFYFFFKKKGNNKTSGAMC